MTPSPLSKVVEFWTEAPVANVLRQMMFEQRKRDTVDLTSLSQDRRWTRAAAVAR